MGSRRRAAQRRVVRFGFLVRARRPALRRRGPKRQVWPKETLLPPWLWLLCAAMKRSLLCFCAKDGFFGEALRCWEAKRGLRIYRVGKRI